MNITLLRLAVFLVFLLTAKTAAAAVQPDGMLDEVAARFLAASSTWGATITGYASWLFWTLVVISMVWTFGLMALRRADIGEFFAEFIKLTLFTGFFWWLLTNGPGFAMSIIDSMRTIGATAAGLPRELTPSEPISIAFDIIVKAGESYSLTSPIDNLSIFFISLAILACLAVVAANVLLALVTAWIMAYAGVFVLGFGGSRWTSDIAINYFRSVLGIGLKLLTMTLLSGVAVSVMDSYYADLSAGTEMRELLVVFVVAFVLALLMHSLPNLIAGLVPGGGAAASSGSSLSAGALIGGAVSAGAAVASGGAALGGAAMAGASNVAGGVSALHAAVEKAQAAMAEGAATDFGGAGDSVFGGGGSHANGESAGTGDTGFAQAAGFAGASSSGDSNSGIGDRFSRAASLAAGTAGELAKGVGAKMAGKFQDRVSQTAGGRLATSIRESMDQQGNDDASDNPASDAADANGSAPSFASDSLSGGNSGGWASQSGGFSGLSSQDQLEARQAHAQWQALDPQQHTSGVEEFVSEAQLRQQECNDEIASFVNRDRQEP